MKKYISVHFAILYASFLLSSCVGYAPRSLLILPDEPMSINGMSYPSMEVLYKSDDKIVIVPSWGIVGKPGRYNQKIEIIDNGGKILYSEEKKNVYIESNRFNCYAIPINDAIRGILSDGSKYTIKFYMNDELMLTQEGKYSDKNIVNSNIKNAVILPFEVLQEKQYFTSSEGLANRFSHPLFIEVKRVIPDTKPSHISKDVIGKPISIGCFTDNKCIDDLKEKFNNDVIIGGKFELGESSMSISTLTVIVYNSKTNTIKKFIARESGSKMQFNLMFSDIIRKLIYEEKILQYLQEA